MARTKTEILYGVHPLEEALRASRRTFKSIYIREGRAERRLTAISAIAAPYAYFASSTVRLSITQSPEVARTLTVCMPGVRVTEVS